MPHLLHPTHISHIRIQAEFEDIYSKTKKFIQTATVRENKKELEILRDMLRTLCDDYCSKFKDIDRLEIEEEMCVNVIGNLKKNNSELYQHLKIKLHYTIDSTELINNIRGVINDTIAQINYIIAQNNYITAQNNNTIAQSNYAIAQNNYATAHNSNISAQTNYNIAQNNNTIAQNSNAIAQNNNTIAQNSNIIAQNSNTIAQKNNTIAQNRNTIALNDDTIALNNNSIARNSNTIAQNSNTIALSSNIIALNNNTSAQNSNTFDEVEFSLVLTNTPENTCTNFVYTLKCSICYPNKFYIGKTLYIEQECYNKITTKSRGNKLSAVCKHMQDAGHAFKIL